MPVVVLDRLWGSGAEEDAAAETHDRTRGGNDHGKGERLNDSDGRSTITRDPESAVLLTALRVHIGTDHPDRLATTRTADVDWELVTRAAKQHGIAPLLYRHLTDHAAHVPQAAWGRLKAAAMDTAERNLRLLHETLTLLDRFDDHGIHAVPYKGPVLAETLYGDPALRRSTDIDLLVREADIDAASELVEAAGYTRSDADVQYERVMDRGLRAHREFHRDGAPPVVELHWQFTNPRLAVPLYTDDVLNAVETVTVQGRTVPVLAPEERFLVLCIHGYRHRWSQIQWIGDIASLLKRHDLDWEHVFSLARASGTERLLHLGLALADRLGGIAHSAELHDVVNSDTKINRLVREIEAELLPAPTDLPDIAKLPFWVRARDRRSDKARVVIRQFIWPGPNDLAAVTLPSALSPTYHAIRPIRLGYRYITGDLGRH